MDPDEYAAVKAEVLARSSLLARLIFLLSEKGLLTSREISDLYDGVIDSLDDDRYRQWDSAEDAQARDSTIELLRDELKTALW